MAQTADDLRKIADEPGRRGEDIRMLPAVVLGQGGAGLAGPAGDGALADLAAADRKAGDGDGETRRT